jgi:hypothetical protein
MISFSIQLYLDIVMAKDFEKYPHLRWGAAYSCMVLIKEVSNILHLDMSDAKQLMNYIICFGPFKNAYVLLPQAGVKVALKEGNFLGFCGSVLAHAARVGSGQRWAINAFTCRGVYRAARAFFKRFDVVI